MKQFFIKRPIFAIALSVVMVIFGLISMSKLPIEQYPNIIPPMVQVNAVYPGADAASVSNAVATPIGESVIGVDNMLYMQSTSSTQGVMTMNITFDIGSDPDLNTILTQNRVNQASSSLPQSVVSEGVTTQKTMTSFLMVIALWGDASIYDQTFLSNYAYINIRNKLLKIDGIGSVEVLGASKYSMRVWLKPDKMDYLNISVADVKSAISGQSGVYPVGSLGAQPNADNTLFTYTMLLPTPIDDASQYEDIVVRAQSEGGEVRLRDIARVELGTETYGQNSMFVDKPASILAIYQSPGSNAVELGQRVDSEMEVLAKSFPNGIGYTKVVDTISVIEAGIEEIIYTLFGVLVLVILIIFLFIQNSRATLIPLLAIPVSLIGSFAFFPLLGLSINVFTLLGLVLAVGLVVDDAIVIVEAVQLNIEDGMSPYDATSAALEKVTPAIIGSTVTLAAVFLPIVFMTGIVGELFSQFALTIAVSFVISGVNALTLSPALSMMILRKETPRKNWFFDRFNSFFEKQKEGYLKRVNVLVRHNRRVVVIIVLLMGLIYAGVELLPSGFLPEEDQGYLFVSYTLPNASSVNQTFEVGSEIQKIVSQNPNVENLCYVAGFNILSSVSATNSGAVFIKLKEWGDRPNSASEVVEQLNGDLYDGVNRAMAFAFAPPSIPGMGNASGFSMVLQNTGNNSITEFAQSAKIFIDSLNKRKEIASAMTQFADDVPQKELVINRSAALKAGIGMESIQSQIAILFGGAYIGNFNRFGQQYRTYIQSDSQYRQDEASLESVYITNNSGQSVPLSSFVSLSDTTGASYISQFNLYPSITITGNAATGYSSGDAITTLEEVAQQTLPDGYEYTWSDITYQEVNNAPNTNTTYAYIVLFVFLILAALFEDWALPLSIILGIPVAMIGAVAIIYVTHILNPLFVDDIFFQISMVLLIGLSAKNAILVIEYAHNAHLGGLSTVEAALEAAKLRFRPILMTALSFILGVVPLIIASGPNAHSRNIIGIALLGGMLTATFIGIFLYPSLYVLVNKLYRKNRIKNE